jgi:hypothetical protein
LTDWISQLWHPLANLWGRRPEPATASGANIAQEFGVVSLFLTMLIVVGGVLWLMRDRTMPPGAWTLVWSMNALGMGLLYDQGAYPFVPVLAQMAAGGAADIIAAIARPAPSRPTAWRLFAAFAPACLALGYFLAVMLTDGIWWSIHFWLGAIVVSGAAGWLLSYLLVPPVVFEPRT